MNPHHEQSQSRPPLTRMDRFQIGASLVPPLALAWLGARKGWIPLPPKPFLLAMPCVLVLGMLFPAAFRAWHRGFTVFQSWLGQQILTLLLTFTFVVAILPVALWLRLTKKSFLTAPEGASSWVPVRKPGSYKDSF